MDRRVYPYSGVVLMKQNYIFEYQNENEFRKIERSVRKYNMLAYKKLTFDYYPQIKSGEFLGKLVSEVDDASGKGKIKSYDLVLPTDDMFVKVHGQMILHYSVYTDKNIVLLTNITCDDNILEEGHRTELKAYKGVMISKDNPEKDMFKINLLNMLQK